MPIASRFTVVLILVTAFVRPSSIMAQSGIATLDTLRLTLSEARTIAIRANPELRAARYGIGVSRGRFRQSGVLLPNPSVDVLSRGEGAEIGLTQEIEIAGQRGARRAAARAGIQRATSGVTDVARLTIAEVDRAFFGLVAASRRLALAEEVMGLNTRLAEFAARQLEAGGISRFEFNLATVELGRSRARTLGARREYQTTASELGQLLAVPPTAVVLPVSADAPSPANMDSAVAALPTDSAGRRRPAYNPLITGTALNVDSLTALALKRRPDLAERTAAVTEAGAEVSVARRESFPNLATRASSEIVDGERQLRPGIGLTLPFFNRNRGEIQARRAAEAQASAERDGVAVRIRAEVARAAAAYEVAAMEAAVLETTVLVTARENRRLLEIAYREGKVGLPVLLLIRNQVIDAELEFWDAWLAQREAGADLAAATGETVAAFDPNRE